MCSLNSRFLRVTAPGHVHLILELSGPGLPSRTYRTSEIQLFLRCSRKRLSVADVTHSPEGHCRTQMLPEQGQIMCHRCAGGSRQISVCLGPFQRKRGFLSPDHIQTLDLMSTHLILNHTLSFCCSVTYMWPHLTTLPHYRVVHGYHCFPQSGTQGHLQLQIKWTKELRKVTRKRFLVTGATIVVACKW